ncbi:hypothetical protein CLI64_29215 [Nostoc sp. CENA543]|nr:hypothetical protein CLI64_29215 [Nostoc sp. CENA543]
MGLDAVELIMGWEKAFGMEITDDEAVTLQTPQMVINLFSAKLGASKTSVGVCPTMRVYYCVRQAIHQVTGLQCREIKLNSNLRNLLPKRNFQETLSEVFSALNLQKPRSFGVGVDMFFKPLTVKDLVNWITAHYPGHFMSKEELWTVWQVSSIVRAVIRDVTGVTHFNDAHDFYHIGIN